MREYPKAVYQSEAVSNGSAKGGNTEFKIKLLLMAPNTLIFVKVTHEATFYSFSMLMPLER